MNGQDRKDLELILYRLDEIEKEFNMKFDLDESLNIKKIGDIKKIFIKHGVKIK